ncbi:MAG TPA: hypothetical protein VHV53_09155 [Solirubrobacterales bacterium]|jgi:hypothetical protein|nr:hypothetical protein [Solirubrobacterales bacterium]
MYFDTTTSATSTLASGTWILDPDRSSVEFRPTLPSRRRTVHAAGESAPLDFSATVRPVGEEFEIEASAEIDQRRLGMTYSPLGMVRPPTKLTLRGRLIRW